MSRKKCGRARQRAKAVVNTVKGVMWMKQQCDENPDCSDAESQAYDKVIGFLEVESFDRDLTIPDDLDVENLKYLHGRSLDELLNAEKRATEYALVESERPNFTIRFPRVDARSVGAFIQLWEITTAYAGLMLKIDPFDQPAVEQGKVLTRQYLSGQVSPGGS